MNCLRIVLVSIYCAMGIKSHLAILGYPYPAAAHLGDVSVALSGHIRNHGPVIDMIDPGL
jgi:hypothetical protein